MQSDPNEKSSSESNTYSWEGSVDPKDAELLRKFDEREYRARREASLKLFVLLVVSIAGLGLIGVASYLALQGYENSTTLMMFLFSGIFLLILGVTAVLGAGIFNQNREREGGEKSATRKTYYDEIENR